MPSRPAPIIAGTKNYGRSKRRLRHRVMVDGKYVFGPGKAEILEAIAETGSLTGAARSVGMSYMRAWKLVGQMQEWFVSPLVELHRGGKSRGAKLTPLGRQALDLYKQMEEEALVATAGTWRKFREIVRPSAGQIRASRQRAGSA